MTFFAPLMSSGAGDHSHDLKIIWSDGLSEFPQILGCKSHCTKIQKIDDSWRRLYREIRQFIGEIINKQYQFRKITEVATNCLMSLYGSAIPCKPETFFV